MYKFCYTSPRGSVGLRPAEAEAPSLLNAIFSSGGNRVALDGRCSCMGASHMETSKRGEMRACTKATLAMKGTAAKRCKLCESQQHNKYCVHHRLKVECFSATAEKTAAALNDLLRQPLAACRHESKNCVRMHFVQLADGPSLHRLQCLVCC